MARWNISRIKTTQIVLKRAHDAAAAANGCERPLHFSQSKPRHRQVLSVFFSFLLPTATASHLVGKQLVNIIH